MLASRVVADSGNANAVGAADSALVVVGTYVGHNLPLGSGKVSATEIVVPVEAVVVALQVVVAVSVPI